MMRPKVSRRAVASGVPVALAVSFLTIPKFAASGGAGGYGPWSPAELQAANEESERLMRQAWRRLDARGASC